MSVGGSFDAYAKSALHERLFGKGADPSLSSIQSSRTRSSRITAICPRCR